MADSKLEHSQIFSALPIALPYHCCMGDCHLAISIREYSSKRTAWNSYHYDLEKLGNMVRHIHSIVSARRRRRRRLSPRASISERYEPLSASTEPFIWAPTLKYHSMRDN